MKNYAKQLRKTFSLGALSVLTAASLVACSGGAADTENSAVSDECTPAHEFDTVKPGVLSVAAYDLPPYMVIESDTSMSGWEGELLTTFAEENCLTVEVLAAGGSAAVIPSVETGRADVAATIWYRTKERAEIVRLSYPTVLDTSGIASSQGITAADLTDGYKIGTQSGNLWNDSLSALLGDNLTIYQDTEAEFSDLAAGRIDAVIEGSVYIQNRLEERPIEGVEIAPVEPIDGVPEFERPGQLNFPSSLENTALGDALDETIKAWHKDGTIADIVAEYGLDPESAKIEEVWEL